MAERKKAPLPPMVRQRADVGVEVGKARLRARFEREVLNHPEPQQHTAEPVIVGEYTDTPAPRPTRSLEPTVMDRGITQRQAEVPAREPREPVGPEPVEASETIADQDVSQDETKASKESKAKASQWDKTKGAATGATQGAVAGRAAGPWGVAAGAVVGAAKGRMTANAAKAADEVSADQRQREHHDDGGLVPMTPAAAQRMSTKARAEAQLDQKLSARGLQDNEQGTERLGPQLG